MQRKSEMKLLLSPGNIAFVVSSDRSNRFPSVPLNLLRERGYKGGIFPINPQFESPQKKQCWSSLSDLPERPDVLFVADRSAGTSQIVAEAMAGDIPFVVLGPGVCDNCVAEAVNSLKVRSNTRILGPDSLGFVNMRDNVFLSCYPMDINQPISKDGNIGLVAQDGALGFSLYTSAAAVGLPFRYVVTTGADMDMDCLDIADFLIEDDKLKFLILSFRELKNGKRFLHLVEKAEGAGIPIAVIHPKSVTAIECNIGAKTSFIDDQSAVWDSVFRQYGVISISGLDDIVDLGHIFSTYQRSCGKKVGILSTSQDAGMLMAEQCLKEGLCVPVLDTEQITCAGMDNFSGKNPLVLSPSFLGDMSPIFSILEQLSAGDGVDIVILVISFMTRGIDIYRKLLEHTSDNSGERVKPVVCCLLPGGKPATVFASHLADAGVPVFPSFQRCARAVSALFSAVRPVKDFPHILSGLDLADSLPEKLTEYHAKRLLSAYGAVTTREKLCNDLEETIEASDMIGYPVALKVMSPNIVRKSQARIIALDLKSSEEVRNAYGRTLQRAVAANPEADIIGVLVQEMLETGIECMINAWRDPVFGPVVSVGLSGIYVEFLHDRSTRIAPVDATTAIDMIKELKGAPILYGIWGRPDYSVDSLAAMVARVSEILYVESKLQSISIDPVFIRENDAVIVDAFMIRRQ